MEYTKKVDYGKVPTYLTEKKRKAAEEATTLQAQTTCRLQQVEILLFSELSWFTAAEAQFLIYDSMSVWLGTGLISLIWPDCLSCFSNSIKDLD